MDQRRIDCLLGIVIEDMWSEILSTIRDESILRSPGPQPSVLGSNPTDSPFAFWTLWDDSETYLGRTKWNRSVARPGLDSEAYRGFRGVEFLCLSAKS